MIQPPGFRGVAFSGSSAGDLRSDREARHRAATALGIAPDWAVVRQVHGGRVVYATGAGERGEADGLYTDRPGLPAAVFTADCLAVAIEGSGGVGIAHAGWRGVVAGVVANLRSTMESLGWDPVRAAIGPGIGPCCFEVGTDVAAQFPGHLSTTTWGTVAVDLPSAVETQLRGLEVWQARVCTHCSDGFFSHRRDGTAFRSAGIGWVP